MKETKDLFSKQATTYAAYRPVYPAALYDFLLSLLPGTGKAWDCATGNGQVANILSRHFTEVFATDISEKQLANAVKKDNILYSVSRAEHTTFPDNNFDLVTIGTALHWFDFDAFYKEATRVAKNNAVIAAWAYAPFRANAAVDAVLDNYYYQIVGPYWDPERRYVDEEYKTIPFPFEEIPAPKFEIVAEWTREQFIGFLNSWSSTQHYITANGINPISLIEEELSKAWPDNEKINIKFPLFIRVGRVIK